jgi:hypothetical protein
MTRKVASFTAALVAVACGGSEPEAKTPAQKSEPSAGASREREAATAADSEPEEKPQAAARRCADGTCFACGSGYCPAGFYCDESTKGGASCSWLPTCAGKSGCACLSRALSGCKCETADNGPHVRCD